MSVRHTLKMPQREDQYQQVIYNTCLSNGRESFSCKQCIGECIILPSPREFISVVPLVSLIILNIFVEKLS